MVYYIPWVSSFSYCYIQYRHDVSQFIPLLHNKYLISDIFAKLYFLGIFIFPLLYSIST